MNTSDTTTDLFSALTNAIAALKNPHKTSKVNAGRINYKFAPLDEIIDLCKPVLKKHGLALMQEAITTSEGVGVTTRIVHENGGWVEMGPLLMPANGGPQDYGSALSYARRYALISALCLMPDEDDDASRAQAVQPKETARVSQPQAEVSGGGGKNAPIKSSDSGVARGASGPSSSPTSITSRGSGGGASIGNPGRRSASPASPPDSGSGIESDIEPRLGAEGGSAGIEAPLNFSKTCDHVFKDAPRAGWEVCTKCGDARKKAK